MNSVKTIRAVCTLLFLSFSVFLIYCFCLKKFYYITTLFSASYFSTILANIFIFSNSINRIIRNLFNFPFESTQKFIINNKSMKAKYIIWLILCSVCVFIANSFKQITPSEMIPNFKQLVFVTILSFTALSDIYEQSVYLIPTIIFGIIGILYSFHSPEKYLICISIYIFLRITAIIFKKILKKEGFGYGDILFISILPLYCDIAWLFSGLFFACAIGTFFGILDLLINRRRRLIPFIPFLFLGVSIAHFVLYNEIGNAFLSKQLGVNCFEI